MEDHEQCFQLLKTRSAENLFIIGDIEKYGYEQDFQKLWGNFNADGLLTAILLKYERNYIPFAAGPFDAEGFADIMSQDTDFSMMSGIKEITEKIEPFIKIKLKRKRQTHYAKCTQLNRDLAGMDCSIVQKAKPSDAEALTALLDSISEFRDSVVREETRRRGLEDGSSRSYFIMEEGCMVSTASTAAENSLSAMVVGVATAEGYKKKGYATKCMVKLCRDLFLEGKELCLFYDNPAAGAIYKRIGFQDIGFWMMNRYA